MEIDIDLGRNGISGGIKKLMDGEEGKEMKERAMKLKEKAMEATSSAQGSSFLNFERLVKEVLNCWLKIDKEYTAPSVPKK